MKKLSKVLLIWIHLKDQDLKTDALTEQALPFVIKFSINPCSLNFWIYLR